MARFLPGEACCLRTKPRIMAAHLSIACRQV